MLGMMLVAVPTLAYAQEGAIAGIVQDTSDAVLPGVLVEVTSPALIEKTRSTTTDGRGQYRITALPIGTYTVTFSLGGFSTVRREDIILSSGFTASVDVKLAVGKVTETITVAAASPTVDVQSARQVTVFTGDDLKDLPISRNLSSIMHLVPGITLQTGVLNADAGICVGGVGVWCSPNAFGFNAHNSILDADGLRQGRLLVDGMVLNTASNPITGIGGGYIADVTNVQEVSFNLSGALGESETGGASINIVPRTGGNRYAGNYSTVYTRNAWFDVNNSTHTSITVSNLVQYNYDVSFAYGGPIQRDRLWFYSVGRSQGKEQIGAGGSIYPNLNYGKWGANYQPDRSQEALSYTNRWRNANTRLTWQASTKNKFNILWDEQDSCQDPCKGTVASFWSPEAQWSVHTYPNRLVQLSWTNPRTNKLLFEGGLNGAMQHYNFTTKVDYDNPQSIPNIRELGDTAGGDSVATRLNQTAGAFALESGSLYSGNLDNYDNWRTRLSASYVSGAHNAKIGWDGQYYWQKQNIIVNQPRMRFTYTTPGATCYNAANPAVSTCGNTSLYYPNDPFNQTRRPVPSSVEINVGDRNYDERVWTNSFYIQDQWTNRRLTLSGAIRYDHARSSYGETCVGPDVFVPIGYCTPAVDGVSFHDITPRINAAWNVFGDGKTAIKFNAGKFLGAAGFQGVFSNANPGRRTLNTLSRNWDDLNGNRRPDCDFTNPAAHSNRGDTCGAVTNLQNFRRFGADPYRLDETGDAIGLQTTHCGRKETGIPQAVKDYCARSGQNLLSGWGKRRSERQVGIGVQREVLTRLSAEVTYNQRWYQNQTLTDTIGVGCDLYAPNTEQCVSDVANLRSPQYSFYSVRAPVDPRLPNGGGYLINGLVDRNTAAALAGPEAIVAVPYEYGWRGIDTNFVYRMRGGVRINGGTSTGKSFRDLCDFEINQPSQRQREGGRGPSCMVWRPWQTNVRGSATYTIPWADVLASVVFQSRPGVERQANVTYTYRDAIWAPGSEWRATNTAGCPTIGATAAPVGCLYGQFNNNNIVINALDFSDMWGERLTLFDLKLGKNFRFGNKRLNVGVDIFNLFNSDAIDNYVNTYTIDNPATAAIEVNNWGNPTSLVSPRFTQLSIQFDF
jgi:hypothetical protein